MFDRLVSPKSSGFTLVELLVVIAIIGILVALLLPAIQAAREAARRSQCQSQLKQISLAVLGYENVKKKLPPGCVPNESTKTVNWNNESVNMWKYAKTGRQGTSWILQVLPYMEYNDIYDGWDFKLDVLANAKLAQTEIPVLYCPSRRANMAGKQTETFEGWTTGGNDYGGCAGWGNVFWDDMDEDYVRPCDHSFSSKFQILRDNMKGNGKYVAGAPEHTVGLFSPFFVQIRRVTDGLSKTIMTGEVQRLGDNDWTRYPWQNECVSSSHDGWALGGASTLFDLDLGEINNGYFEHPGSEHPGGAHFGLGDGSVRFITEDVEANVMRFYSCYKDEMVGQLPN